MLSLNFFDLIFFHFKEYYYFVVTIVEGPKQALDFLDVVYISVAYITNINRNAHNLVHLVTYYV